MPDIPIRVHLGGQKYGVRFQNERLPDDYFHQDPWRADGDGAVLKRYTCLVCGARSASWEGFKAHRSRCGEAGEGDPELAALKAAAILEELEEGEAA